MVSENIVVTPAKYDDIAAMIEICRQNLVATNDQKFTAEDFAKKGFLITALNEETAKKFIDDGNFIVLVARYGQDILGYTIACDLEVSGINFPEDMKQKFLPKTVYHKQIAKVLNSSTNAKAVGSNLLKGLFLEAQKRQYQQVVCRIVHEPFFNQNSVSFHQKNGFELIGSMQEKNLFGIYSKIL